MVLLSLRHLFVLPIYEETGVVMQETSLLHTYFRKPFEVWVLKVKYSEVALAFG
jgi:hypothetical protein